MASSLINRPGVLPTAKSLLYDEQRERLKDELVKHILEGKTPIRATLLVMHEQKAPLQEVEAALEELVQEAADGLGQNEVHDIVVQNTLHNFQRLLRKFTNEAMQEVPVDDLPTTKAIKTKMQTEAARTAVALSQEVTRLFGLKDDTYSPKKKVELTVDIRGEEKNKRAVAILLGEGELDEQEAVEVDEDE